MDLGIHTSMISLPIAPLFINFIIVLKMTRAYLRDVS